MAAKYVRVGATSRPTREETMETLYDSYLHIKKILKKMEDIYNRETNYRRKKYLANAQSENK